MNAKAPSLPPISGSNWLACPGCGLLFHCPDGANRCPICRQKPLNGGEPRWFYARNNQKQGPVTRAELRRLVSSGGLYADDMVLAEGSRTWVPAKSLEGLFPTAAIPLPPSPEPSTLRMGAAGADPASTTPYDGPSDSATTSRKWPSVPGYEILGVLGRGGMGVVYRARQVALKRPVALKMILSAGHAGDEALARFKVEAEAVARLRHPTIVQVFESGSAEGHPYLALEYIEGGTLSQKLRGTPLTAQEAAALSKRLAEGMQTAHTAGVIHRDLKPANVLLDGGSLEHPKIADFGLAKTLDDDSARTRTGQVMGTPSYMAPEQANGHLDQIGPRTDVYALGAILYELLTGRPPFRGTSVLDTLEQVRTQEPVPPSHLLPTIPRDLESICLKCLQKEPQRRFGSAQEFAEDLGRFLDNRPTLARPTSRLEAAGKFARRNKVIVGIFVTLLVATIVSAVSAGIARSQRNEAKKQEAEAKKQEAEAKKQVQLARIATLKLNQQTGRHRRAIELADEILAGNCDDEVEIRLLKLKSLMGVSRFPEAVEELTLLKKLPLGNREGRVILDEVELDRKSSVDAKTKRIQEAINKGLPPGDLEYAQGLIAERAVDAVNLFQQAIKKDPYHYSSHQVLALLLTLIGRSRESRDIAIRGQALFPDDPTFPVTRAVSEAMEGRLAQARELVEQARPQMGDKFCELLKTSLEAFIFFQDWEGLLSAVLEGKAEKILENLWARLAPSAEQLMPWMAKERLNQNAEMIQLESVLSLPPFVKKSFGAVALPPAVLLGDVNDETYREVRKTADNNQEGLTWFLLAMILTKKGQFAEASEAYEKAGRLPCVGGSLRRPSLFYGLACEVAALKEEKDQAILQRLRSRAGEHLREYLDTGRPIKPVEGMYLSIISLSVGNPEVCRLLLLRWADSDPGNQALPGYRMEVEYLNENFTEAYKLARDLVRANPKDERALEIRDKSLERLQKIARGG